MNCLLPEQLTHNAAVVPDLLATPFRVGYLNVGYRRFRLSLEGIADLIKQQRPDIFLLGDMGSSRDQIGRLRQRLEAKKRRRVVSLDRCLCAAGIPGWYGSSDLLFFSPIHQKR
jgi:hypothetical protein